MERDSLINKNEKLQEKIYLMKGERSETNGEVQHKKKFVQMMNNRTLQLNKLLERGHVAGDFSGVGYTSTTKEKQNTREDKGKGKMYEEKNNYQKVWYQHKKIVYVIQQSNRKFVSI